MASKQLPARAMRCPSAMRFPKPSLYRNVASEYRRRWYACPTCIPPSGTPPRPAIANERTEQKSGGFRQILNHLNGMHDPTDTAVRVSLNEAC